MYTFNAEKVQGWYATDVDKVPGVSSWRNQTKVITVDMAIPVMREKTARWVINFYNYIKSRRIISKNGWKKCATADVVLSEVPE